jgi:hypothetical protein
MMNVSGRIKQYSVAEDYYGQNTIFLAGNLYFKVTVHFLV